MRQFIPTRQDVKLLLKLAVPIVTAQVGVMMMGVVDTIMVGHVSARELAAVSLGLLYTMGISVFCMGTLWAIDPVVSQAAGAKDDEGVALGLQRGLLLAAILGTAAALLCVAAEPVFRLLRQPADVVPRAARFVWVSAPSLPAMLVWITLRQGLQAMKLLRPVVITTIVGNVTNLALNWVFVYGNLGSPAMGAVGSALSSSIGRFVSLALVLYLARHTLAPKLRPLRPTVWARGPLMQTLKIGVPIGIQVMAEYATFGTIAVLAGWFGANAISGHQVALNLASLMFMVPMGIGSAASVLVGRAIGEGDLPHARRAAASALMCGAGFMVLSAIVMLAIPGLLARAYTSVPGVAAVAAALIPIAGVFQVFDGLQVVAAGALRGAHDTRASMIANVLGFWLVGIPVSLWLGFGRSLGVVGLWWGFVAGLAAVATFLVLRVRVRLSSELKRLNVEAAAT